MAEMTPGFYWLSQAGMPPQVVEVGEDGEVYFPGCDWNGRDTTQTVSGTWWPGPLAPPVGA